MTREADPQVLLIQRKNAPFAGCWALPGGFVDEGEPLIVAARRELREETGLSLDDLEQLQAFGDPGRDPRGWTVSVAYFARIEPGLMVQAADDAADARWFALARPPELAFDHAHILDRVRIRLADRFCE